MLLGFFNQKSNARAVVQVTNVISIGLISYTWLTKPEAGYELALDLLSHALSYFAMQENASVFTQVAATVINSARLGAIYSGVTEGSSCASLTENIGDAGVHLINTYLPYITSNDAAAENDPSITAKL